MLQYPRMKKQRFHTIYLLLTGFTMGTADLIPGVSGGTIAFLAGIYEELLDSIKTVTGKALKLALQGQFAAAAHSIPFAFLLPLGIGLFTAIFSLAGLLSWLLVSYPTYVWALFFGLVLASTVIVLKRVKRWTAGAAVGFVIATIAAYFVVGLVPVATPATALMTFASGAIAICAMILPGISGSFILLILGQYERILTAAVERDFTTLAIFTLGCVVGLALFARILSWLFARYHDLAVATLAGVMLGSIRKIWPWKEDGYNAFPETFNATVAIALVLSLVGACIVWQLDKRKVVKEHAVDGNHDLK